MAMFPGKHSQSFEAVCLALGRQPSTTDEKEDTQSHWKGYAIGGAVLSQMPQLVVETKYCAIENYNIP